MLILPRDRLLRSQRSIIPGQGWHLDTRYSLPAIDRGAVASWRDASGHGRDFACAVELSQPTLAIASGIRWHPVVRFGGGAQYLTNAADLIGVGDVTLLFVAQINGPGGGNAGRIIDNGSFRVACSSGGVLTVTSDGLMAAPASSGAIPFGTPSVVAITRRRGTNGVCSIYVNGVISGTANQSSHTPAAGAATYLGNNAAGDRGLNGLLGDVWLFNRILSIGEIVALSRGLTQRLAAQVGNAPALPFEDLFGAAGALDAPWEGANWAIGVSGAACTPTLSGTELLTDPGLEADYAAGLCSSLTKLGTPNVAESADAHGGSKAQQFQAAGVSECVRQAVAGLIAGGMYHGRVWAKRTAGTTGGARFRVSGGGGLDVRVPITDAAYTEKPALLVPYSTAQVFFAPAYDGGSSGYDTVIVDDVSLQRIVLPSMFALIDFQVTDVQVNADVTCVRGSGVGVVACANNPTCPTAFVLGFVDGPQAHLWAVTGSTTIARKIDANITAVDGALLEVKRSGKSYELWYNGVQIGATQTIDDAAINDNTCHGIWSSYAGNLVGRCAVAPYVAADQSDLPLGTIDEKIRLVWVTDTHVVNYDEHQADLALAVDDCNTWAPQAMLHTGDIGHQRAASTLTAFNELARARRPVISVMAAHDENEIELGVGNPNTTPVLGDRAFGLDRDTMGTSLPPPFYETFVLQSGDGTFKARCFVLDSDFYADDPYGGGLDNPYHEPGERFGIAAENPVGGYYCQLGAEQLDWVESTLAADATSNAILIFAHIPPMAFEDNEIVIDYRALADVLEADGRPVVGFCGHDHSNGEVLALFNTAGDWSAPWYKAPAMYESHSWTRATLSCAEGVLSVESLSVRHYTNPGGWTLTAPFAEAS